MVVVSTVLVCRYGSCIPQFLVVAIVPGCRTKIVVFTALVTYASVGSSLGWTLYKLRGAGEASTVSR